MTTFFVPSCPASRVDVAAALLLASTLASTASLATSTASLAACIDFSMVLAILFSNVIEGRVSRRSRLSSASFSLLTSIATKNSRIAPAKISQENERIVFLHYKCIRTYEELVRKFQPNQPLYQLPDEHSTVVYSLSKTG